MKRDKILALLLSAVFAAVLLAGCAFPAAPTATPAPSSAAGGEDMILQLAGMPRDTVVLTVDGSPVTAEEYLFWIAQATIELRQSGQIAEGEEFDWTATYEGVPVTEYLNNNAKETAKLYRGAAALMQAAGASSTEEDVAEYEQQMATMAEEMGGEDFLALWLKGSAMTKEGFWEINKVPMAFSRYVEETYFVAGAPGAPTAAQMEAYIAENDILMAKHILLTTVDTMGQRDAATGKYPPLDAAVVTEKKQKADALLAQLRAAQNPLELFDTLMNENSEDTGLAQYPGGYTFTAGEMVPAFEDATRTLKYGGVSDVVESDFGYHIILRLSPDSAGLRQQWCNEQIDTQLSKKIDEAKVETTKDYDKLDLEAFYNALNALQEQVDAEMAALEEALATPAPSAAPSPAP